MCRGAKSPNNAAVRIIWAAAFYCPLAPPSAAPRLLWRDCFPRTMVPHSTCLLFLAFSWNWQLLKSTFVLAELLKSTSSWSCPIFPFDTAHHLPALFPKSLHLLVTLSPTGGRFQYRQVQLKAEKSKTACMKLDFSRPNSNWTAFSAMKAYRDPYRLIAISNESSFAASQGASRGCSERLCSSHVGCRRERNHSDLWQHHCYGVARWASKRCFSVRCGCNRTPHIDGQDELCQGTVSTAVLLPPNTLQANNPTPARTYSIRHIPISRRRRRSSCRPWLIGLSPVVLRAARPAGDSPISPKAPSDTPPFTFLGIMYL